MAIMLVMIALIVLLGLYPQPVLDTAAGALETIRQEAGVSLRAARSIEDVNTVWQPQGYLWAVLPEPDQKGVP
jgi:hypothetical protein